MSNKHFGYNYFIYIVIYVSFVYITGQINTLDIIIVCMLYMFQFCIYFRSNKHVGYNYFMYSIYVPILYILWVK